MDANVKPGVVHGWAIVNDKGAKTKKYVYFSAHRLKSGTIKAHCRSRRASWEQCQADGDRIVRYDMFELGHGKT